MKPHDSMIMQENILVTGAGGQIGTELIERLQKEYGADHIFPSDLRQIDNVQNAFILDVTNREALEQACVKNQITQIYHMAAILSAKGEENPLWAWNINMSSLFNVLETAVKQKIRRVFYPSSIAVFGLHTPHDLAPQNVVLVPETIYGITKAAGENLANYYFKKYELDIRSVRYPGIIGYKSMPGGGTTDYAVDIYHKAVLGEDFDCFLASNTMLPMMYMDDALDATIRLMQADSSRLTLRTSYNIAGISFTPAEVYHEIQKHYTDFKITYSPDFRQAIAASWPGVIDDSAARQDWDWSPQFDLGKMTSTMIEGLIQKYK